MWEEEFSMANRKTNESRVEKLVFPINTSTDADGDKNDFW